MTMEASTTLMMSSQTGIFLLFFSFVFLLIFLYLLYIFWPTSHDDVKWKTERYADTDKRYKY